MIMTGITNNQQQQAMTDNISIRLTMISNENSSNNRQYQQQLTATTSNN